MVAQAEDTAREPLLMRGVLDMCVLALLDREPLHAYAVVQELQTHGFAHAGYGTIYPLVMRLRRQGLVDQQLQASPSGPARNILKINADGRAALATWAAQWRRTTQNVTSVLAARDKSQEVETNAV